MESYILVDSAQRTSGVANSYTYRLKTVLKGVHKAELLSAGFQQLSSCNHVVLDILEFRHPRNANGNFGVINNVMPINSNIAYTQSSFYPIQTTFENPFDIGSLNVTWRDPTNNIISMNDNSLLLKISHIK